MEKSENLPENQKQKKKLGIKFWDQEQLIKCLSGAKQLNKSAY